MQVTINGSLCGSSVYVNEPCTAVTICAVGTTNCQTITNILLDTGSYGLRIFSSVVSAGVLGALNPVATTNPSGNAAECATFGTGKSWGGIRSTDVILAGESPVTVPVQYIDSTYVSEATYCNGAYSSPSVTGFNGILGVGLFAQDCGTTCTNILPPKIYYACNGGSCSGVDATHGAQISLANQVVNPVNNLSADNTGIILSLPSIGNTGVTSVVGCVILGIGTQANNSPSGVTTFPTNGSGDFTTTLNGSNYSSFLDSGSNGYFVPAAAIGNPGTSGSWFIPGSTLDFATTNLANGGSPTSVFNLEVANANNLFATGNSVFDNLSGPYSSLIDLGLPYFFGRNVYVGIAAKATSLGTGPYWAY
jgi:hypothetical protein